MTESASRKSRFLSPGWLMFGSALLCVALVPAVYAAMNYSSDKKERYRELAAMTKSERLKVEHAFEEFQNLTPEQQEGFRDLHKSLNGEDMALKGTLAEYQEFLRSLSPVDRAELDRATTSRQRLSVIQRIQEDRALRQQQIETGMAEVEEFRSSHFRHFEVFSSAEMEAIASIIEARLPTDAVRKVHLDTYSGPARFAATIAAAMHAWGPKKSPQSRQEHMEFMKQEFFEADLREEIISAVQNEEIREKLAESDSDAERDHKLRFYAYGTIGKTHFDSYPGAAELNKFLDTLDAETKKELMSKEPWRLYRELGQRYLRRHPKDISKAIDEFPDDMGPLDPPPWFQRGRRGRGPDGRGPDGRRPDDERGRFDREGGRDSRGQSGDFNDRGPERGSRDGSFGDRSGNRRPPEAENRSSSE